MYSGQWADLPRPPPHTLNLCERGGRLACVTSQHVASATQAARSLPSHWPTRPTVKVGGGEGAGGGTRGPGQM